MTIDNPFLAGVEPPTHLTEPRGRVLPCDNPNYTWLGHGLCQETDGSLVVFGWQQKRAGDRWLVRYAYNGAHAPGPESYPLEAFGDVMRLVMKLNREEGQKRASMLIKERTADV